MGMSSGSYSNFGMSLWSSKTSIPPKCTDKLSSWFSLWIMLALKLFSTLLEGEIISISLTSYPWGRITSIFLICLNLN